MTRENAQDDQPQDSGNENLPVEFKFKDHKIRTIMQSDDPWFIAADVCAALGIKNTTQAVDRLDDDEKGLCESTLCQTEGGPKELNIVNEFGLYRLILRSDKAIAKQFQRWVIHEVLPSIRKTGRYEARQETKIPPNNEAGRLLDESRRKDIYDACNIEVLCHTLHVIRAHWARADLMSDVLSKDIKYWNADLIRLDAAITNGDYLADAFSLHRHEKWRETFEYATRNR